MNEHSAEDPVREASVCPEARYRQRSSQIMSGWVGGMRFGDKEASS